MDRIIGSCGIVCEECPALIAYRTNDNDLRVKTAAQWSQAYGATITAEMVNCTGCRTEGGPKIGHCADCHIRSCAVDKGVLTCADCGEYGCDAITSFFEMVPPARDVLEGLRSER